MENYWDIQGKLPEIYVSIIVKSYILSRVRLRGDKGIVHIGEIRVGGILFVNAGSTAVLSTVKEISGDNNEIKTFILSFLFVVKIKKKLLILTYWMGWILKGGKLFQKLTSKLFIEKQYLNILYF